MRNLNCWLRRGQWSFTTITCEMQNGVLNSSLFKSSPWIAWTMMKWTQREKTDPFLWKYEMVCPPYPLNVLPLWYCGPLSPWAPEPLSPWAPEPLSPWAPEPLSSCDTRLDCRDSYHLRLCDTWSQSRNLIGPCCWRQLLWYCTLHTLISFQLYHSGRLHRTSPP